MAQFDKINDENLDSMIVNFIKIGQFRQLKSTKKQER